jgi:hypothetical protein
MCLTMSCCLLPAILLFFFPPLAQVWLSYAKFEATPLAVLATPAEEDEEQDDEARQQQLAEAEAAEGGAAGTGEAWSAGGWVG